jgi:hypothetical protein
MKMNEREWYASKEHEETEMNYEEYCKRFSKKRNKLDTPDLGLD